MTRRLLPTTTSSTTTTTTTGKMSAESTHRPVCFSPRHPAKGYDRTCIRRLTASEYAMELELEREGANLSSVEGNDPKLQEKQKTSVVGGSTKSTAAGSSYRSGLLTSRHPNIVFSSKYPVYNRLGQELCVLYQAQSLDVSNELRRLGASVGDGHHGRRTDSRGSACRPSCLVPLTEDSTILRRPTGVEFLRLGHQNYDQSEDDDETAAEASATTTTTMKPATTTMAIAAGQPHQRRVLFGADVGVAASGPEPDRDRSYSSPPPSRSCSSRPSVFSIYRESRTRQSVCSRGSRPTSSFPSAHELALAVEADYDDDEGRIGEKRRRGQSPPPSTLSTLDQHHYHWLGHRRSEKEMIDSIPCHERDSDSEDEKASETAWRVGHPVMDRMPTAPPALGSSVPFQRVRRVSPVPSAPVTRAMKSTNVLDPVRRQIPFHSCSPPPPAQEETLTQLKEIENERAPAAPQQGSGTAVLPVTAQESSLSHKTEELKRQTLLGPPVRASTAVLSRFSAGSLSSTTPPQPYPNPLPPTLYGGVSATIVPFSAVAEAMERALEQRCASLLGVDGAAAAAVVSPSTAVPLSRPPPFLQLASLASASPAVTVPPQDSCGETKLTTSALPSLGLGLTRVTPTLKPGETVLLGEDSYRLLTVSQDDCHTHTNDVRMPSNGPTDVFRAMSCNDEDVEALVYRWRRAHCGSSRSRGVPFQPAETLRAALGLQLLCGSEVEVRGFAFSDGGITVVRLPRGYRAVPLSRVAATADAREYVLLLRLLLKMVSTLLARRVVHGRMDALEQIWLAVPFHSALGEAPPPPPPSSSSSSGAAPVLVLPLHWERAVDFSMFADRNVGGQVPLQFDDTASVSPTPLSHSRDVRAEVALSTPTSEVRHGTDLRSLLHELLSMPGCKGLDNPLYCMAQRLLLRAAEPSPAAAQLVLPLQRFLRELPCDENDESASCVAMLKAHLKRE